MHDAFVKRDDHEVGGLACSRNVSREGGEGVWVDAFECGGRSDRPAVGGLDAYICAAGLIGLAQALSGPTQL